MTPVHTHSDAHDFLKKAVGVAQHYGFSPVRGVSTKKRKQKNARRKRGKTARRTTFETRKIDAVGGELVGALQACIEHNQMPLTAPLLFYYSSADVRARRTKKVLPKKIVFSLGIVGAPHSIAEALIIRTTLAILEDLGQRDVHVCLNSVGDRDSGIRFSRELTSYLKRNQDSLPPQIQTALKEDVLLVLEYLRRRHHELCDDVPRPMEFLSEKSRRHLREVIEYLETIDVSYELDDTLVGHRDCYTDTVFEIRTARARVSEESTTEYTIVAKGGRCDEFGRRFLRTNESAVGIVLVCNPKKVLTRDLKVHAVPRRPKVCFIQLGFDAKLKGLGVIEMLRKAKVPLHQTLVSTTLAGQIAAVEELGIPYTIIMGQKEALEGTVIVRNMSTRSQNIIAVDLLPQYLKQMS